MEPTPFKRDSLVWRWAYAFTLQENEPKEVWDCIVWGRLLLNIVPIILLNAFVWFILAPLELTYLACATTFLFFHVGTRLALDREHYMDCPQLFLGYRLLEYLWVLNHCCVEIGWLTPVLGTGRNRKSPGTIVFASFVALILFGLLCSYVPGLINELPGIGHNIASDVEWIADRVSYLGVALVVIAAFFALRLIIRALYQSDSGRMLGEMYRSWCEKHCTLRPVM